MPADSASSPPTSVPDPPALLDPIAWFSHHPRIAIGLGGFCLWVSVSLIIRMWFLHRKARFLKKLFWSGVLLFPFVGWFLYAGLFQPLGYNPEQGTTEHFDAMGGGMGI